MSTALGKEALPCEVPPSGVLLLELLGEFKSPASSLPTDVRAGLRPFPVRFVLLFSEGGMLSRTLGSVVSVRFFSPVGHRVGQESVIGPVIDAQVARIFVSAWYLTG